MDKTHKRPGPKPRIKRTDGPTATQQKIIDIAQRNPALSCSQIGAIAKCDHSHVVRTLNRYGIDSDQLDDYKNHRADILAGLQHRLLNSVTDDEIKKTPLGGRILAAAQLYDKERIERGLSDRSSKPLVVIQVRGDVQLSTSQTPVDNPVDIPMINDNAKIE